MQGIVTGMNARSKFTKLRRAAVVRDAVSIDNWLCAFMFGRYSEASDIPAVL